jgi:hypothetical protein
LDGNPTHAPSLSQTQFAKPSDTNLKNGASKASSPDVTRTAMGLRTLGQNVAQTTDKQSFLKKNQTQSDVVQSQFNKLSQVLDQTASHEDKASAAVLSTVRSAIATQKMTTFTSNPTSNKAAVKGTAPGKSKSFLQPSEFIQSLKADKNGPKKVSDSLKDGTFRSSAQSESTLSSKHTFSKISGPKKGGEKKENGGSPGDMSTDDALENFQAAYESHIVEMKGILAKDEAILNEMRRQKNLTSTGLALFMDAWKNLLNQKIRQVNGWKEIIKAVESTAKSEKGDHRFVSIGNGMTRDECIAEESLYEGEEV